MSRINEYKGEQGYVPDRRANHFRFDKSINIPTIISSLILLWTLVTGLNRIYMQVQQNYTRTNIMWSHFVKEHNDLTPEERYVVETQK